MLVIWHTIGTQSLKPLIFCIKQLKTGRLRLNMHINQGFKSNKRSHSGDNGVEDPPVPIPNTEVKLYCAESTYALRVGRIGRCRISIKNARFSLKIGRFSAISALFQAFRKILLSRSKARLLSFKIELFGFFVAYSAKTMALLLFVYFN